MISTSAQEIQKQQILFLVIIYLVISLVVIYSLCKLGARRKRKNKFLKKGPFWLERVFGNTTGKYVSRSFSIVCFLFFLDYFLSEWQYPPLSLLLTSTASFFGLLLSRSLYHRMTEDTVPYITSRLDETTKKHKAEMLSIVDPAYEKMLKEVYKSMKSGSVIKENVRLAYFLSIEEVRNDISRVSEWPLTPVTYAEGIVNVTIPVIIEVALKFLF